MQHLLSSTDPDYKHEFLLLSAFIFCFRLLEVTVKLPTQDTVRIPALCAYLYGYLYIIVLWVLVLVLLLYGSTVRTGGLVNLTCGLIYSYGTHVRARTIRCFYDTVLPKDTTE